MENGGAAACKAADGSGMKDGIRKMMTRPRWSCFVQGVAGKLDSMLIPAFSMLIRQGTACAVEGDIKVAKIFNVPVDVITR